MRYSRSEYELQQLSKFWFDLSKIILGSLVLKLFEPGRPVVTFGSLLTLLLGVVFSAWCAKLGLKFAREVRHL